MLKHFNLSGPDEDSTMERDRRGYLNCKKCSIRFLTEVGFQNHLNIQHGSTVIEVQQTAHKDASNAM